MICGAEVSRPCNVALPNWLVGAGDGREEANCVELQLAKSDEASARVAEARRLGFCTSTEEILYDDYKKCNLLGVCEAFVI